MRWTSFGLYYWKTGSPLYRIHGCYQAINLAYFRLPNSGTKLKEQLKHDRSRKKIGNFGKYQGHLENMVCEFDQRCAFPFQFCANQFLFVTFGKFSSPEDYIVIIIVIYKSWTCKNRWSSCCYWTVCNRYRKLWWCGTKIQDSRSNLWRH